MKRRVVFRADGNSEIGLGHLVRSTALAAMLSADFKIMFAVHNPNEGAVKIIHTVTNDIIRLSTHQATEFSALILTEDIVVLDGYTFNTEYQEKVKSKGCWLVCIDDIHSYHFVADLVLNQSSEVSKSDYSAENYTKFCLGFEYALLRKSFLNKQSKVFREKVENVLISMGGADTQNISYKVAQGLAKAQLFKNINILTGSANTNLPSLKQLSSLENSIKLYIDLSEEEVCALMLANDVAYCPASSVAIECCALGIPLITGCTASNQRGILKSLMANNACMNIGDWNAVNNSELIKDTLKLCNDLLKRNEMIAQQRKLVDGHSGERLLKLFKSFPDA